MVNSREKKYLYPWVCLILSIVYHVPFITIHSQYRSTDYFPPVLAGVDVIDFGMNHCGIMRHHSRRPRPSYPKTAVLPLGRTGRTTASRPGRLGTLLVSAASIAQSPSSISDNMSGYGRAEVLYPDRRFP